MNVNETSKDWSIKGFFFFKVKQNRFLLKERERRERERERARESTSKKEHSVCQHGKSTGEKEREMEGKKIPETAFGGG